jgi:aspartate kinase
MVVMKFGGTSVADAAAIARLCDIVSAHRRACSGEALLVVVSALAGVTDRLMAMADAAAQGRGEEAIAAVRDLARRHEALADELSAHAAADAGSAVVAAQAGARANAGSVRGEVAAVFARLEQVAGALSVVAEVSPRSRDAMAATGELASSRLVALALTRAGIETAWVDAREALITSADHGAALPDLAATRAALAVSVAPHLARGTTVVVGGYVGATPGGVVTTLGRGGSDYSAAFFGAALGAREIQIWTDVDGLLTADPRLVDEAQLVDTLTFGEAAELAYFGAKVLHPSTILPAIEHDIPVRVLNSRRPDGPGSRIVGTPAAASGGLAPQAPGATDATGAPEAADVPGERPPPGLTAVAAKRGVTRIDIASTRMLMAHGFLARVFAVFERHQTPVDVVTTSEVSVSVTIDDTRALDDIVAELQGFSEVAVEHGMAIVAAVGDDLQRDPTLAARVLGALDGMRVAMVSQGGSRRNITFVLPEGDTAAAMRRLHDRRRRHAQAGTQKAVEGAAPGGPRERPPTNPGLPREPRS